jgi:hypothetical protein
MFRRSIIQYAKISFNYVSVDRFGGFSGGCTGYSYQSQRRVLYGPLGGERGL